MEIAEKTLAEQVPLRASGLFGTDCCFTNIAHIYCGWLCSEENKDWLLWEGPANGVKNMTMYVAPQAAAALFESCRKVGMEISGCYLVEQMYPDGAALLAEIGSDKDPTYRPTLTAQRVKIRVGFHPITGKAWNETLIAGCRKDLIGCDIPESLAVPTFVNWALFGIGMAISTIF
jgi:hypothetical protein